MYRYEVIKKHYSRLEVQKEISKFAISRWVGIHCEKIDEKGRNILIRYNKKKEPLKISNPEKILKIISDFEKYRPRTFYASINVYKKLNLIEDTLNRDNIIACTPTWDIDNDLSKWPATIAIIEEIISFLSNHKIEKSIYIKWSGNGCHIHLHEESISLNLRKKINPLDLAYSIVEYVNNKLYEKFLKIKNNFKAENLIIENKIDPQRLYTCPLSIHRKQYLTCVCIDKNDLHNFTPEWVKINDFKHFYNWNNFLPNEADEFALKAYENIGPYPYYPKIRRRKTIPLDKQIMKWLKKFEEEKY